MVQPTLLAYNLDEALAASLRALCERQQILYRPVESYEYAAPIGVLAGIPVAGKPSNLIVRTFQEPMLVMCHMLNPQLDAFLLGMRQEGLPRIPLKAVLTPYNVAWNSRQLRDELLQEHEAVRRNNTNPGT